MKPNKSRMQELFRQKGFWDNSDYDGSGGSPRLQHIAADTLIDLQAKPGNKILVLGCGPGFELEEICCRVRGGEVIAIEPSDMIKTAQVKARKLTDIFPTTNIELIRGFGEYLPLNGKFDCAISINTFRYLVDPVKTYEQIFDVLKPDGRLALADTKGKLKNLQHFINHKIPYDMKVIKALESKGIYVDYLSLPQQHYYFITFSRNPAMHKQNLEELEWRNNIQKAGMYVRGEIKT